MIKRIFRLLLGSALLFAGIGHLSFARTDFRAQVRPWLPLDVDFVVLASGVVEIILGLGLLLPIRLSGYFGLVTAVFFVAIFPGNIAQFVEQRDAFGLDSDSARAIRLLFQPVLVIWAIWCTDAIKLLRPRQESNLRLRD